MRQGWLSKGTHWKSRFNGKVPIRVICRCLCKYISVCHSREVTSAGMLVWKLGVLAVPSELRFHFSSVCLPYTTGQGTYSKDLIAVFKNMVCEIMKYSSRVTNYLEVLFPGVKLWLYPKVTTAWAILPVRRHKRCFQPRTSAWALGTSDWSFTCHPALLWNQRKMLFLETV